MTSSMIRDALHVGLFTFCNENKRVHIELRYAFSCEVRHVSVFVLSVFVV